MTATDGQELTCVEVDLPRDLLRDMDEYAVTHGFENPSAVVSAALEG